MPANPLAQVMNGSKDVKSLTENQAKSALAAAAGQIAKGKKTAANLKENGKHAVSLVIHTAESGSSLFLASMAEGFAVSKGKSLKIGPVDARLIAGAPLQLWGIVDCMRGKGGGHQLAVGNGLVGSMVASLGLQAGQALAEKRAGNSDAAANDGNGNNTNQIPEDNGVTVQMTPTTEGHREVLLHPSAEGGRRPRRPGKKRSKIRR